MYTQKFSPESLDNNYGFSFRAAGSDVTDFFDNNGNYVGFGYNAPEGCIVTTTKSVRMAMPVYYDNDTFDDIDKSDFNIAYYYGDEF